jgi:hypothetical protein
VERIAPAIGAVDQDKLSLADFQLSEKGQIMACPSGHAPAKIKKRKRPALVLLHSIAIIAHNVHHAL